MAKKLQVKIRTIGPKANTLEFAFGGLRGNYREGPGISIVGRLIDKSGDEKIRKSIQAHWKDDILTEDESAKVHTNQGALTDVTLTLPTSPDVGTWYAFAVPDFNGYKLIVDPGAAKIYASGTIATGKYIWADSLGESLKLIANSAGDWVTIGHRGVWTFET